MANIYAVMKRELLSYFCSPIAFVVIVIFLLVAGLFFYTGVTLYGEESFEAQRMAGMGAERSLTVARAILRPTFGNLGIVMLLMMPLLTMRLFSEEKKSGSIELLFTWPITDFQLTMGKYLSALIVLMVAMMGTAPFSVIIGVFTAIPWGVFASCYLGLLLMGAAFLSLGTFVSSLTENQIVSAVITFGVLLLFWVGAWSVTQTGGVWNSVIKYLSILDHQDPFYLGVIDTVHLVYYFSFIFIFLFLTLRVLESNKWRG